MRITLSISQRMRQLRCERGLTQGQVADALSVSVQAVSKWECGKNLPDIVLLPEIADLFGVSIDQLFRDAPDAEDGSEKQ